MKKLFVISAVSLSMVLASCGGKEDDAKSADAKKDGSGEPKTACDCMKWANTEIDKILSMTMEDIAKNPNVGKEFEEKMKANTTCEKLTKEMKPEDAKDCPAISEFMDKVGKLGQMMGQASGDGMEEMEPAAGAELGGEAAEMLEDAPDAEM